MKSIKLLVLLVLFCDSSFAQTPDSVLTNSKMDSMLKISTQYLKQSKFEEALGFAQQAREIAVSSFGPLSISLANVSIHMARTYMAMRKWKEAKETYVSTLEILKKENVESDSLKFICLTNLKVVYINLGDYKNARNMILEILPRIEKKWGKESPQYGQFKLDLGILYRETNEYDKAEEIFIGYANTIERTHGKNDPGYARNLINLGLLYSNMGSYDKSKKIYLEAKDLLSKNSSVTDTMAYLGLLQNLGILYWQTGEFKNAEPLFLESLPIMAKIWGKENLNYVGGLINLGLLYEALGDFVKAIPLYEDALFIFEQKLKNTEHPFYLNCLHNLAYIYFKTSKYKESEDLNLKALNTREKLLGVNHEDYAQSLLNLSKLYLKLDNKENVELYLTRLFKNLENQISTAFSFLSENERDQFIKNNVVAKFDLIQSAAKQFRSPGLSDLSYRATLAMKGIQLKTGISTMTFVLQQKDSQALNIYNELIALRGRLANQYELPLAQRKAVTELEEKKEQQEKELARLSSKFRQDQKLSRITEADIKTLLKPGEASIEFIHFAKKNEDQKSTIWYGANLLLPQKENAIFIPLFEESQMSVFVSDKNERKVDYVDRLYSMPDRGAQSIADPKPNLYELIWKPLDSLLANVHTIYCSPTGLLNRLNLGAIPIDDESNIGDKYLLRIMLSTRQILMENEEPNELKKDAWIYSGIQYDYDSISVKNKIQSLSPPHNVFAEKELISYVQRSNTSAKNNMPSWEYLKWTKKEGEKINDLLKRNAFNTVFLTGPNATEESLKSMGSQTNSPQTIHLATHGYFFPEPSSTKRNVDSSISFMNSQNAMVRSGLILFGANRVWGGEKKLEGIDDGILTAFEISQMNLTNTNLVVLSACETGLGDIVGREGVYGLQRAFKMAGVKYLIQSLWQVPDFQTQDLMTTFYQKWLEQKMNIPEAFRLAQQEMRNKYQNPYFWAGFVLVE